MHTVAEERQPGNAQCGLTAAQAEASAAAARMAEALAESERLQQDNASLAATFTERLEAADRGLLQRAQHLEAELIRCHSYLL